MYKIILIVLFLGSQQFGFAQTALKWWDPIQHQFPVIEGQAWTSEVKDPYDRLTSRAQKNVREAVWELSKNSAGLMIRFRSNAEEIIVRYGVRGEHAMNHMPATGVSGVDLYAIDSDGNWLWCRGRRNFSDTITYHFSGLEPSDNYHKMGREYRLYLPLYNSVEWLQIGVKASDYFRPLPVRKEKPIVVYGTSIAQGACASRPGMAWTSIVERKLDRPLINLAFSGNGRLEKEMIDLLVEIDAKVYVLDCLPNLWRSETYSSEEVKQRILESVRRLKEKRPKVPVLLTEHAGYTDGFISPERMTAYRRVNEIQKEALSQLKAEGHKGVYYLSNEEIHLGLDDMVDGTHPNDLGMMHYAEAYEKSLRSLLQEPTGQASTTHPIIQYREPGNYDWEDRHRSILEMNATEPPKTVIFANSIIHFWGGLPRSKIVREEDSWEKVFTPMGVKNYAYGWDRIENVLWRIYHGELDGFYADHVVVMIGTNNLHLNTDMEIIEGLELITQAIKTRQPTAKITLMGILPRREQEDRVAKLNAKIKKITHQENIEHADLGEAFLNSENKLEESYFSDGLHPNAEGYRKLRTVLQPILERKP